MSYKHEEAEWDKVAVVIFLGLTGFVVGVILGTYVAFHYMVPNTRQNSSIELVQTIPHWDELHVELGGQSIAPLQAQPTQSDPQEVVAGYNALTWSLK